MWKINRKWNLRNKNSINRLFIFLFIFYNKCFPMHCIFRSVCLKLKYLFQCKNLNFKKKQIALGCIKRLKAILGCLYLRLNWIPPKHFVLTVSSSTAAASSNTECTFQNMQNCDSIFLQAYIFMYSNLKINIFPNLFLLIPSYKSFTIDQYFSCNYHIKL